MVHRKNGEKKYRLRKILRKVAPAAGIAGLATVALAWPTLDGPISAVLTGVLVWRGGQRGD
ncbi:MAG TPA: hypothetical protein VFA06_09340 [Actinocrinis sp.]|uniref:hypothetical protein n=1 Tax=Actinocrinis sp. TaxID=1920516 RepID=UPI002D618675|nr:hypothetical protein [Actinocrinis sp.]HZU56056.1 hypothetical protein [Actinocrinis sp.]